MTHILTTPPMNFLGLEPERSDADGSRVVIWPIPYEKTVSYGSGTAGGPAAIIEASRYVEFYDEDFGRETADVGVHTLPPADSGAEHEAFLDSLYAGAREVMRGGKFLCSLGGEHSITPPLVKAAAEAFGRLSVLQIDAHADLRDSYEGTKWSHACAMRRVVEICPAVQLGIRSISTEEAAAAPTLPTRVLYAKDTVGRSDWLPGAIEHLSDNVYLTIDVDGLDPSVVPFTGTPEPGGFGWYQTLEIVRAVTAARNVVAMDVVELCPPVGSHASSFAIAKLIYKTLGYIFDRRLRTSAETVA